jgi:hypothetical protein
MKHVLHFAILILLLNSCFLFSPRPKSDTNFCGDYIAINAYAGFVRNCDATEFIESAISPSALLRENYVRQSRPLYVLVASGIGYTIYYTHTIFDSMHWLSIEKSMYAAYVCMNFIILILTLILFEKIVIRLTHGKIPYVVILLLSVFATSNFMTKAFFWTVHQQMFVFLMPLLGIYICMNISKATHVKWVLLLSFLFGIGMLAYGSFLILFVVSIFYFCYVLYIKRKLFSIYTPILLVGAFVLFVLPTILWMFFLKYKGVTYYNHEIVRYRQLVWIIDEMSISFGAFVLALYQNALSFFKTIPRLYLFFTMLLITCVIRKIKNVNILAWNENTKLILLNLICFGGFFILLGYYADRLTFSLMPIILCLSVANFKGALSDKKMQIALMITVLIWHAVNVLSFGPFS